MGLDDIVKGLLMGHHRSRGSHHGGHHGGHHDDHHDGYRRDPFYPEAPVPAARPAVPARVVVCTSCDADNAPNARFCQQCGKALRAQPETCRECRAELVGDAKFCPQCGAVRQNAI